MTQTLRREIIQTVFGVLQNYYDDVQNKDIAKIIADELIELRAFQEPKTKQTKKGDAIDGLLFYGKQAKDQGVDKVEELLCEIERGIHVNIQRSNDNQIIARKILKDGREFGRWLTWRIQDEWWAARLYIFADLTKMWEQWPAAFETKTDETRPEYKPFPLAGAK